jgi:hypothetical protein
MAVNKSIRAALRRMDTMRTQWWICRRDSDPPEVWHIRRNPYREEWDWRILAGSNKRHAERRITAVRDELKKQGKLRDIRSIVDKMRERGAR